MKTTRSGKMKQVAAEIVSFLGQNGVSVVLVGGLAVAIYSQDRYLTNDIDLVDTSRQAPERLNGLMRRLGFSKEGRVFVHSDYDFVVEFPPAPLAVGDELIIEHTVVETTDGSIPILKAVDVVKDRLSAYIHWKDRQSLVQACAIVVNHHLDWDEELIDFCVRESDSGQTSMITSLIREVQSCAITEMEEIELVLMNHLIRLL